MHNYSHLQKELEEKIQTKNDLEKKIKCLEISISELEEELCIQKTIVRAKMLGLYQYNKKDYSRWLDLARRRTTKSKRITATKKVVYINTYLGEFCILYSKTQKNILNIYKNYKAKIAPIPRKEHAAIRAMERYGIDLNDTIQNQIHLQIEYGHALYICKNIWKVIIDSKEIYIVYNLKNKKLITTLCKGHVQKKLKLCNFSMEI